MADIPFELADGLGEQLSRILDVEGKIPRALEALGPVLDRDVVLIDAPNGLRRMQLEELGARVTQVGDAADLAGLPAASADVVVGLWSSFRGAPPADVERAERVLRPGGRLLAVHDYGRDDVSYLRGRDRPEYGAWTKRNGPFLNSGFKVRVIHCFWTFDSMDDCRAFLARAFADAGTAVAERLKRPRLSYNVAVYHRSFGELAEPTSEASTEELPEPAA